MNRSELTRKFERWLDDALPSLTPLNSIDVHIDELCGRGLSPQAQVDATLYLFQAILENLAVKLAGKIVMLAVPLRSSKTLDPSPPEWDELSGQLSHTPPSVYVMHVTALLQADPAQRYVTGANVPLAAEPAIAPYYQCWRNLDDPDEDGWARDVRIISTAFIGW